MNFSSVTTNTNIDFNSRMICVVNGDDIMEVNNSGQTQVIGKSNKWCNDLLEVANEYKKLCVDNGLIEEEKTPEQLAKEQIELMQQMMSQMVNMQKEIEVLKNEQSKSNGYDTTRGEPTRDRPKQGKPSGEPSNAKSTRSAD